MRTPGQPALREAKGPDGLTAGGSIRWVALVITMYCALAGALRAQDADTREIAAYRLTDVTLAKYIRASRALAAVAKPVAPDTADDEEADEEEDDEEEGDNEKSITEVVAEYDANPAARRAITSAGLTTREYVVFTFALFQAGMAAWLVEQQGWSQLPRDVSRPNVEFYQRHKAAIDSVTAELKQQ